jgi:leucyl-tRNA synthetase
LEWADSGVDGAARFLRRVWSMGYRLKNCIDVSANLAAKPPGPLPEPIAALRREIHLQLRQANYDFAKHQFNTVASSAMKMLNSMEKALQDAANDFTQTPAGVAVITECLGILLRLLSPITPHICHTLWRGLGYGDDILNAPWPEPEEAALVHNELELVLQINGKHRGNLRIKVGADGTADRADIEAAALASEVAQKFMAGSPAKKVVVVPGRLVNIVI